MNRNCPNSSCSSFAKPSSVIRSGYYFRKNDSRKISRFKCVDCGKRFSSSTGTLEFNHKKRRINHTLFKLFASGVSMRRCAILLNIHRTTVKRKFIYLAQKSRMSHKSFLQNLVLNKVNELQFDDLITSHHTKLKPLSVSAAVDASRRFILAAEVSTIPAFGHLADLSRKKYGKRENLHRQGLERLFKTLKDVVEEGAIIKSDEHKAYPEFVGRHFPQATYMRYKGGRGCVAGQGELKKLHFDPLFALNHTFAMMRANINRLFRRTWCTTKDISMLKNHIDIYICFHNNYLV